MKYCSKCGNELFDEAVICPSCGCPVEGASQPNSSTQSPETKKTLRTVAKVFMLISLISSALALIAGIICLWFDRGLAVRGISSGISLAWIIPMTVYYWKSVKENRPVSVGFKVCTLLFVNLVSGICMLVDKDEY